ncbi:MAG: hypothetical protein Q8L20_14345 [Gammaproteobacteria bacterium]|nr:hypothetical protein [Gammaproteobacteria bacterium]
MTTATLYRGLNLHPDIIYYDEIRKFSPGVKVEKDGWFTQRIALDPQYYVLETEAEIRSLVLGRHFIDTHLDINETLYFDYQE